MSYDPLPKIEYLKALLGQPVSYRIPKNFEPEWKYKMRGFRDLGATFTALNTRGAKEAGLVILPKRHTRKGRLVSAVIDTVDEDGYPTFEFDKADLQARSRSEYIPGSNEMRKQDINAKDKRRNGTHRREWEDTVDDFESGYARFLKKYGIDLPEVFRQASAKRLCVETLFMVSRCAFDGYTPAKKKYATVIFSFMNDAVVFAPPHINDIEKHRLKKEHRLELENEAIHVIGRKNQFKTDKDGEMVDPGEIMEVIDYAAISLENIILETPGIEKYNDSKSEESFRKTESLYKRIGVAQHYTKEARQIWPEGPCQAGRYAALISNVAPDTLINNKSGLKMLAETLPTSCQLKPENILDEEKLRDLCEKFPHFAGPM